jgi:hypothetical protein
MYDSPRSLQEACVDFICENLEALCEVTPVFQQTSSGILGVKMQIMVQVRHHTRLCFDRELCTFLLWVVVWLDGFEVD